jgi:hypothetical protein
MSSVKCGRLALSSQFGIDNAGRLVLLQIAALRQQVSVGIFVPAQTKKYSDDSCSKVSYEEHVLTWLR